MRTSLVGFFNLPKKSFQESKLEKDFLDIIKMVAPGTILRIALNDLLRAKMGALIVFDNGSHRNYNDENNYSRAVEYAINENDKTVQQVWQYGKKRGNGFFSAIVSDVDYLSNTKNILVTSGHISPQNNHSGKIIEVDQTTGEEVFEATLYYKTVRGKRINGWGQMDILYRSQRLKLEY